MNMNIQYELWNAAFPSISPILSTSDREWLLDYLVRRLSRESQLGLITGYKIVHRVGENDSGEAVRASAAHHRSEVPNGSGCALRTRHHAITVLPHHVVALESDQFRGVIGHIVPGRGVSDWALQVGRTDLTWEEYIQALHLSLAQLLDSEQYGALFCCQMPTQPARPEQFERKGAADDIGNIIERQLEESYGLPLNTLALRLHDAEALPQRQEGELLSTAA